MRVLAAEFPNPIQPKLLASMAGVGYEAAKKWLQRNEGVDVVRVAPGWFRCRATLQLLRNIDLEPLMVHGLQVVIDRALLSRSRGSPPPLGGLRLGNPDKDGVRRGEWEGRLVSVDEGSEKILVSLRASKQPLTVGEFAQFSSVLEGGAGTDHARIVSVDLNLDVAQHKLRMRGVESMSLGEFRGALWKLYQKQVLQATRLEACLHRVDLSMSEAAHLLNELATPLRYEPPARDPLEPEVT